jgi:hypothetical protein
MKRDMDLIREIAFAIEEHPSGYAPDRFAIEGYTQDQIKYHLFLMLDGGLIHGDVITTADSSGPEAEATSLTWTGHEFAEAARSDTIWNRAKMTVKTKGLELGALGFGVLTEYLKQQVKEQLGLA